MRSSVVLACAILVLAAAAPAQRRAAAFKPSTELSFSLAAGQTRSVYRVESDGGVSQYESSQAYGILAMRSGFFFAPWLSFEPEFLVSARDGALPVHALSANFSFMYLIPRTPVAPFILLGYGAGNGVPHAGRLSDRATNEPWDVRLANAGIGAKFFVASSGAIRVEYRFQMATHEHTTRESEYTYTTKQTWYNNDLFVGVAVFL